MKKILLVFLFLHIVSSALLAQIITPIIKANFGVDADLRSNYFNNAFSVGNDDWFRYPGLGSTGEFVIDTSGAAALLAQYTANPATRRLPFYRSMRFPAFSVVNNKRLLAAIFTRDYHGDDSTMYASGSNKNGMSPVSWSTPVAQSVPDKNEILDMMVHVRRDGTASTDSLWMIGGLSIENTTGNRYFDFEMYQTDIFYNRPTLSFSGYGPDAGHTSWTFDASGNITQPGDIIFTAEYSSSSLTMVEARIWVKKTDWESVTPAAFNWSGLFDGDGSGATYGYASITPNTAGAFYTGLQSAANTWAGPFALVMGNNTVVGTYTAGQFMEFSVNLTKLGLDPVTLIGGSACGMPFRKVLVKTRASTSFTAALKDFVGPFDFFLAAQANVATNTPYICDTSSVSNLYVTNPVSTSTYVWNTSNGAISGGNTGTSINVNSPGSYIVTQYLQAGCPAYAADTIQVLPFPFCEVLANNLTRFTGERKNKDVSLAWTVTDNKLVQYFDVERSFDGTSYSEIKRVQVNTDINKTVYRLTDNISAIQPAFIYYRLKIKTTAGSIKISNVVQFNIESLKPLQLSVMPNPAKNNLLIGVNMKQQGLVQIKIVDLAGRIISIHKMATQTGKPNTADIDISKLPSGMYQVVAEWEHKRVTEKFITVK